MKRKKRIIGVLMLVTALIIMQLPMSEADAAASASDFKMEGSTLVKYRGTEKNVSVPKTVTAIGRGAFEDNKNIELVVLPNSVTQIEPYAFWGCDNLDTVVLGKEITAVGDYAFAGCKGLEQMTIPANVSSIGVQAFGDCVNLKDISIPTQTLYIHETAFDGCARLTIHCDAGSAADEYAKAFYERQKEMPEYEDVPNYAPSDPVQPSDPGTPTPSPVPEPTEVPGNVLGSTHVVGNQAVVFVDNRQLPVYGGVSQDSGTQGSDGEQPEDGASPLPEGSGLGQGNSLPKFSVVDGCVIADQAYYRSGKLGSVELPEGILQIGEFGFARSSLTDIVLPEGAETICYGAFYHCDYLQDVTLPETVLYVEPKAFSHTLWVDRFLKGEGGDGDFLTEGGVLIAYRGSAREVRIPEGVRVIAGEAFQNHGEIESLILPDSLTVVGEGAFEGCGGLDQITFGKKVEEIKDRAFKGTALTEVFVPSSVKKLGLQAFGTALITYEGREAEYTHENSASRLSNEDYRIYGRAEEQEPGVEVSGIVGGYASLEGADRPYSLKVEETENREEMERAFERSFQRALPDDVTVYELTLTDSSGIPLTKLGSQALTVVLPLPEGLKGQSLGLFALDRNGQLEVLPVERVSAEGVESMRFETNQLFGFGVYGMGEAAEGETLSEISVELGKLGARPENKTAFRSTLQGILGFGLGGTGLVLLLADLIKRRPHVRRVNADNER